VLTIAALVRDPAAQTRLRGSIRSYAALVFCDTAAELSAAVADGGASAVITEWHDGRGITVDWTIKCLRNDYPTVPVLIYAPLTPEGAHNMLTAARAGVVDAIIANFDDVGVTLGRRLAAAQSTALADRAVTRLAALVPSSVAQLLDYFFRHARTAPSVASAATALQVHRKTLALHCARAQLPTPSALCCWVRLILAAQRLEDPGRTTERAAMELGFPSGSAFRNMLKRYTDLTPSDVRERGGSMCLVELLAVRLAACAQAAGNGPAHHALAPKSPSSVRDLIPPVKPPTKGTMH
jgi:AraC-like DNA-binding protein